MQTYASPLPESCLIQPMEQREQKPNLFGLCRNIVQTRAESSLFGIAEVQPILSKDNQKGWYLVRSVSPNLFSLQKFYRTAINYILICVKWMFSFVFFFQFVCVSSYPFFAKISLVMLNNLYFAPTMWVHFSWCLYYKFLPSHNQERVKFLLKHHRAS